MQKPKLKRLVGRPSKYTPELAARICARIAEGESLRDLCTGADRKVWPSRFAIYQWLAARSDFRAMYTAARDHQADSLAEEALDAGRTANSGNAAARAVKIRAIQWYTSKVAPRKYGDKLDMNVTGQVTIGDAIEEGRKRVARMREAKT